MPNQREKGKLVILTGPPGCGKTTLRKAYAARYAAEGVHQVITNTTRKRRSKNEFDYNFITRREYRKMQKADETIAENKFAGNLYCTCKGDLGLALSGMTVVWTIDINAAANIVKTLMDEFPMQEAIQLVSGLEVVMVGVERLTVAKDRFISRETEKIAEKRSEERQKRLRKIRDDFRTRINIEWESWGKSKILWRNPNTNVFHVIESRRVDQEVEDLRLIIQGGK